MAIVNRHEGNGTIEEQSGVEAAWISQSSMCSGSLPLLADNSLTAHGSRHLGLPALIEAVDWVICQHLSQKWIPSELDKIDQRRLELTQSMTRLGKPVTDSAVLFARAEAKLVAAFDEAYLNSLCSHVVSFWPKVSPSVSLYRQTISRRSCVSEWLQVIKDGHFFTELLQLVTSTVGKCFQEDRRGSIQLRRFSKLCSHYAAATRECLSRNYTRFCALLSQEGPLLWESLPLLVMEHLLLPAFENGAGGFAFFSVARGLCAKDGDPLHDDHAALLERHNRNLRLLVDSRHLLSRLVSRVCGWRMERRGGEAEKGQGKESRVRWSLSMEV